MNKIIISFCQSLYLIYMFHYFKTSIDFNLTASSDNWLFGHPSGDEYSLRICPFGRIAIFPLIFIILGRHYLKISKKKIKFFFILSFILSLMNLNAIVYLIPIWFIELI